MNSVCNDNCVCVCLQNSNLQHCVVSYQVQLSSPFRNCDHGILGDKHTSITLFLSFPVD